jgi:hypothetical protein
LSAIKVLILVCVQELAAFLKKRSGCEDDHAKELRRLCKITMDGLRGRESRQGSYASQFEEVIKLHDRMAENEVSFSLNLHQMSADLDTLGYEVERGRKQWKQTGLAAEQRVQEAERMLEKAKQKYDSLAEDYDHAKTGDKSAGRHFGLRGPKSAAQHEEDLLRKLQAADQDYKGKVESAQHLRKELMDSSRPQAVQALKQLIMECDSGVALQLQKFGMFPLMCLTLSFSYFLAAFNEKLLLGNGLLISPLSDGDSTRRSLRDIVTQVDNDKDFQNHVLSFSSQVPGTKDIKYEQHPVSHIQLRAPSEHL